MKVQRQVKQKSETGYFGLYDAHLRPQRPAIRGPASPDQASESSATAP